MINVLVREETQGQTDTQEVGPRETEAEFGGMQPAAEE